MMQIRPILKKPVLFFPAYRMAKKFKANGYTVDYAIYPEYSVWKISERGVPVGEFRRTERPCGNLVFRQANMHTPVPWLTFSYTNTIINAPDTYEVAAGQ